MFGVVLRAHRLRVGLTQDELAAKAGVSVRNLRDIETGRVARPRVSTVRLLAHALGLAPDDFAAFQRLAGEDVHPPVEPGPPGCCIDGRGGRRELSPVRRARLHRSPR